MLESSRPIGEEMLRTVNRNTLKAGEQHTCSARFAVDQWASARADFFDSHPQSS